MQLSYRGATYNYIPCAVETMETPTTARFLGVKYRVCRPVNVPIASPNLAVRYRGIHSILG
ncbi:MAG: DUF4278 domain-containing protein [Coleofasciculus sp. Co-bin14]|nr:DUF4278 domain-containing protein [Coleofasciculus sp. Co-bin14]